MIIGAYWYAFDKIMQREVIICENVCGAFLKLMIPPTCMLSLFNESKFINKN